MERREGRGEEGGNSWDDACLVRRWPGCGACRNLRSGLRFQGPDWTLDTRVGILIYQQEKGTG